MSNERAKFLNSRRRHKTDVAIARQVQIARQHGMTFSDRHIKEPHRHAKHHAMDCGNANCMLCGNPRRNAWFKKDRLTNQEKKLFQDVENIRDTHSNGLKNGDDTSE
jgi:hypothetical protein